MMIYVLSEEIAEKWDLLKVTSAYEDFSFANIAAMILDPALSTCSHRSSLLGLCRTLLQLLRPGPLVPYTWFPGNHSPLQRRDPGILRIQRASTLPFLRRLQVWTMKIPLRCWTDPRQGPVEIAIVIDDNEIGRNFMAYLQEVYGDDALKDYLGAIAGNSG